MVDIHDRRPVTLSSELAREWLDPATEKERAEQMALLQGEPTEAFEWFKVDRAVGNVRNRGPELIKPIRWSRTGTHLKPSFLNRVFQTHYLS